MQMTYRKAIIILDRLVTAERIEVDRKELREAVKVAQKALNIVAYLPPNHGRLIDADANVGSYVETWTCNCSEFGTQRVMAVDDLKYLSTIIEAEVSE